MRLSSSIASGVGTPSAGSGHNGANGSATRRPSSPRRGFSNRIVPQEAKGNVNVEIGAAKPDRSTGISRTTTERRDASPHDCLMATNVSLLAPYAPVKPIGVDFCTALTHPRFTLARPEGVEFRLAGLSNFTEAVSDEIKKMLSKLQSAPVIQNSSALVVKNCSGVGKTVASLGVSVRLNKAGLHPGWFFFPLYLGFNSSFGLTRAEGSRVTRDCKVDLNIESVLFRRLFLQLTALMEVTKEGATLQEATTDTTQETMWCPMMPFPIHREFEEYVLFPDPYELPEVERKCIDMIKALRERCGGERLGLMLIIDEGQHFDEQSAGGARSALRWARQLQLALWDANQRVLLVPMMTGINPATSLSHNADGSNVSVTASPLTEDEFRAMIRANRPNEQDPKIVAALTYPIARMAIEAVDNETLMAGCTISSAHAPLMLIATGAHMQLPQSLWHPSVPARIHGFTEASFTPRVPLIALNAYLRHIHCIGSFDVPSTLLALKRVLNAGAFENQAFEVLRLLFALLNTPLDSSHGIEDLGYYKDAYHMLYRSGQSQLCNTFSWLRVGQLRPYFPKLSFPMEKSDNSVCQRAYIPSSHLTGHKEAFKIGLRNVPAHPLHRGIQKLLECSVFADTEPGSWCSIHAGGSAPVDYIFIFRVAQAPTGGAPQLVLRLADAKHASDKDKRKRGALRKMATSFRRVSDYLKAVLLEEYGANVVDEQFAVITNCRHEKQSVNVNAEDGRDTCIHYMSPDTFQFSPITDLIYDGGEKEVFTQRNSKPRMGGVMRG